MNDQLQKFARDNIKSGLAQLNEKSHILFKLMYSPKDRDADINEIVDNMPEERLDWAMQQVQRSIEIDES